MEDDGLLQEFLEESREHLAGIEADLLAIEEDGEHLNENLVNKVFRAAHSIKGGSGFFNLVKIQELAHRTETVLAQIRSQDMTPNPEIINILLQAFDQLRELISDPMDTANTDISDHLVALAGLSSSFLPQDQKISLSKQTDLTPPGYPWLIHIPEIDFLQAQKKGKYIYALEYDLAVDLESRDRSPLDVLKTLESCGNVLDAGIRMEAVGTLEDFQWQRIPFLVVFASVLEPSLAKEIFELPDDQIQILWNPRQKSPLPVSRLPVVPAEEAHSGPVSVHAPVEAPPTAIQKASPLMGSDSASPSSEVSTSGGELSLRVHIAVLDNLMNLAGELVLSRNQLREAVNQKDERAIQICNQRINLVTSELQEAVMATRLQPIGNIFNKFPRVVRDLARKLGKEILLNLEGKEVELDKSLIEGLSDPLTHMVRNAVDHGIESPEKRQESGKARSGQILLKAYHEAGQVVIEVLDDGKGLDPERLAQSAVSKGLIQPEQIKGLSNRDKIGLIFLPGFSTADQITDISGRGVGMDVVKTNLEKLGGKMEIESELGRGTRFRIKLPLTLAIIPSLVFSTGKERFALPQVNIAELIRIPAEQVQKRIEIIGDSEALLLRGDLIPLVRFADLLGIPRTFTHPSTGELLPDRRARLADRRSPRRALDQEEMNEASSEEGRRSQGRRSQVSGDLQIIVISTGLLQYGLVVDQLHSTEEIVVKPLGRHLQGQSEYAGATLMGDGTVALILDAGGLAAKANLVALSGSARARQIAEKARQEQAADLHAFLTFHNGPGEFCALPLDLVLRVERVSAQQIEQLGGRRTMQYRGMSLPLVALEDAAKVHSLNGNENLAVIVFNAAGKEMGLLVAMPVDVVETKVQIDQATLRQPGIAGSTLIRNQTTLIVDVFELLESAHPEWMHLASPIKPGSERSPGWILLAEDSDFFRNQVKKYLQSENYEVVEASDGEEAWDLLQQNATDIRVLITDIEMPRLSGLGLTERIRRDTRFRHLPILGLTSLAGDDDRARGLAAGINEYQVKLDRDRLIESLRRIWPNPSVHKIHS